MGTADVAALRRALPDYDLGGVIESGAFGVDVEVTKTSSARRVAIEALQPDLAERHDVRCQFEELTA